MTPKHNQKQKAKSGGTSSPKTSEKEELVQARAVKRAERVEAGASRQKNARKLYVLITFRATNSGRRAATE